MSENLADSVWERGEENIRKPIPIRLLPKPDFSNNDEQSVEDFSGSNIVFLDVDGVLNNSCTKDAIKEYIGIDDSKVAVLKEMVQWRIAFRSANQQSDHVRRRTVRLCPYRFVTPHICRHLR